jgi:hypothetical protein
MYTRRTLLEPATRLCTAFASSSSIPTLLSHFTRSPLPAIHEHGHPSLAPFLGRTFTGADGAGRYFTLLQDHLNIQDIEFDAEDQWIVDTESMAVSVRGSARFEWKATGQAWDETFCYRLGMAEEMDEADENGGDKGKLKVQEYLVWSDTGAAYLARTGKLKEVQEERERGGKESSRSRERRRSGCGEVVGSGLGAYGSCR